MGGRKHGSVAGSAVQTDTARDAQMKPERNVERMTPVAVMFLKIDKGTMAAGRRTSIDGGC